MTFVALMCPPPWTTSPLDPSAPAAEMVEPVKFATPPVSTTTTAASFLVVASLELVTLAVPPLVEVGLLVGPT